MHPYTPVRSVVTCVTLLTTVLLLKTTAFSEGVYTNKIVVEEKDQAELIESMDKLRETVAGGRNNRGFDATLWMQWSAEFRLITRQTYLLAGNELEKLVARQEEREKKGENPLPPAVVLDIDETVLDNSPSQAWAVSTGKGFVSEVWDEWIDRAEAKPIDGVKRYIERAKELGVSVIYISNREAKDFKDHPLKEKTLKNLRDTVDPDATLETIYLKYDSSHPDYTEKSEWGSDKKGRRAIVEKKYTVLQYIGDDLGDMIDDIKKYSKISPHGRYEKGIEDAQVKNDKGAVTDDRWGKEWFLLPNPTYGSWLRSQQANHFDRVVPFK